MNNIKENLQAQAQEEAQKIAESEKEKDIKAIKAEFDKTAQEDVKKIILSNSVTGFPKTILIDGAPFCVYSQEDQKQVYQDLYANGYRADGSGCSAHEAIMSHLHKVEQGTQFVESGFIPENNVFVDGQEYLIKGNKIFDLDAKIVASIEEDIISQCSPEVLNYIATSKIKEYCAKRAAQLDEQLDDFDDDFDDDAE